MNVTPPVERHNESAGYLGYYCRTYLPTEFDLVDWDGSTPAIWWYSKTATGILRVIEEKPNNQQLHPSQDRTLRRLSRFSDNEGHCISSYVIWEAEKLVTPIFPIRITRLGTTKDTDEHRSMTQKQFDRWLLDGLQPLDDAGHTMSTLDALTSLPFRPTDIPDTLDWAEVDSHLVGIAKALHAND